MIVNIDVDKSKYAQKALQLKANGHDCAQAVFLAFDDLYNIDRKTALRLTSAFSRGIGGLKEVCGTITGITMVVGILYGYSEPADEATKLKFFDKFYELVSQFECITGSILCRDLLILDDHKHISVVENGIENKYEKRSCTELIGLAAALLENYIKDNPPIFI